MGTHLETALADSERPWKQVAVAAFSLVVAVFAAIALVGNSGGESGGAEPADMEAIDGGAAEAAPLAAGGPQVVYLTGSAEQAAMMRQSVGLLALTSAIVVPRYTIVIVEPGQLATARHWFALAASPQVNGGLALRIAAAR